MARSTDYVPFEIAFLSGIDLKGFPRLSGNETKLYLNCWAALWLDGKRQTISLKEAQEIAKRVHMRVTSVSKWLTNCTNIGIIDRHGEMYNFKGLLNMRARFYKHKLEPKAEQPSQAKPSQTKPTVLMDDLFDRFWSAYPKREGSNPRKPAHDKFEKLVTAGTDPEAIILGATHYAKHMRDKQTEGTEYVAQAKTWLNQERWNDYQTPIKVKPHGKPGTTQRPTGKPGKYANHGSIERVPDLSPGT